MRTQTILIGLASIAILAVLAFMFLPRLAAPSQVPAARLPPPSYWPTEDWRTSTPEEGGFDSVKLVEGLQALHNDGVPIDSLLIIRNGSVLLDAYFQPYDGSFPHDLASVTKSFTTILIGIAAGQGKFKLDQPMVSLFPRRSIDNLDSRKQSMTVLHLAGMMNGFESGCLAGDEPTLDAMRSNTDWVRAALNRKMVRDPGLAFCYDSPGMHILSAILQETTGMTELDFGRQYLFEPLGIRDVIWQTDPQGYTHGWGDLHLKPLDAAKLGYLWLSNGLWDGKQIVPASWIADTVKFHNHAGEDDYGYGWWVNKDGYYAVGRGGQTVRVYPAYNAIVVATGSNLDYDQVDRVLHASFLDPVKPLPANPAGVTQLQATVAALAQAPAPMVTQTLPDTARAISGKTFVFEPDAAQQLNLVSGRFEFNDTTESSLYLKLTYGEATWRIGLGGKYHQGTDGQALRGYWADPHTFVVEAFDVGVVTYQFRFDGDRVLLTSPNIVGEFQGVAGTQ
jgi:CubicO group peptidase (beta-lactamase class C family)